MLVVSRNYRDTEYSPRSRYSATMSWLIHIGAGVWIGFDARVRGRILHIEFDWANPAWGIASQAKIDSRRRCVSSFSSKSLWLRYNLMKLVFNHSMISVRKA